MYGFGFELSDCMQRNCYDHRKCNTVDSIYCFRRFNNLKQVNFYIYLDIRQHIRKVEIQFDKLTIGFHLAESSFVW